MTLIDARTLPDNDSIDTDICVVGAGVAGITLVREFIDQDFKVCLLESGGLEPDQDAQSLCQGENIGLPYYPLDFTRFRGLGGSGNSWDIAIADDMLGVRLRPLDELDFEERDWVPYSGWPFNKSHLDPYYNRAQSHFHIENSSFDVLIWEDQHKRPRLPLRDEIVGTIIYKFGDRDIFIRDPRSEISQAKNITAFFNATVLEIETDEAARNITHLRVGSLSGIRFRVSAKLFILALGGIETPRLLLLSNRNQKTGIGNQNDLVGRFFMEHLHFWKSVFVPADPGMFKRTLLYNQIHSVDRVPIIGKLALMEKVVRGEKLLNQNIQLMPSVLSKEEYYSTYVYPRFKSESLGGTLTNAFRSIKRFTGEFSWTRINAYRFANMTEQAPNPSSRITLSEDRDRFGQNRIRLDWQVTAQDIQSAVRTQEIIGHELVRTEQGRFFNAMKDGETPDNLHGGHHHMGTTRMNDNPKLGVVDQNCRVHGISNLYIAGPSVFPTGGYANPVLTINALAIRLADHIKERMQ